MRTFSQRNLARLLAELKLLIKARDGSNQQSGERDFLSVLKNTVFFVAVHLYFAGWIYNFYLYQHFGINLGSLNIPFYYFFVYSFTVIYLNAIWFIGIAIGLVLLLAFAERYQRAKKWAIPTFLILLFPLIFVLSKNSANKSALDIRRGKGDTKTIVFVFKKNSSLGEREKTDDDATTSENDVPGEYRSDFLDANRQQSLRLLVHTDDKYYVFLQPPPEPEDAKTGGDEELDIGYTFEVLKSDVELVTIVIP